MKKLAVARKSLDAVYAQEQILAARAKLMMLGPSGLYLFGSAADGKLTDQSDLDFLLVFKDALALKAAQSKIKTLFPICEMSIDLVWITEEEFERKKRLGGVAMEAFEYGKRLDGESNGSAI
jgi:predicted nucleotidyltransferase